MGFVHVVMFAFKPSASAADVQGVCERMLALKENCVHPETKKPYIKSSIGGKDNSPEGIQHGITHVFISEFETEEDRAYYLGKDPTHLEFGNSIGDVVSKVQVVDFTPSVF